MRALMLRHAPTASNLKKRYVGSTDEPLCDEGCAMAGRLGSAPNVRKAYVSPKLRSMQTAAIWYPNAELVRVEGLKEMDFGLYEGRAHEELMQEESYRAWVEGGCEAPCPGGEDKRSFSQRVCAAFEVVVEQAQAEDAGQLIIVAHGGTAMAVLDRYARDGRGYFEWSVGPCEGYALHIDKTTWNESRLVAVLGKVQGGAGAP